MPQKKSKQPSRKNKGRVGKFPTQEDRIKGLLQEAYTREGRNAQIARAVLKELDRPLKRRESDRALGRRLGVDHRTIGRWRERITIQRRKRRVVSRRKLLGLCQTLSKLNIVVVARKLVPEDIRLCVIPAYMALHRFMNGPRTLPNRRRRKRRTSLNGRAPRK